MKGQEPLLALLPAVAATRDEEFDCDETLDRMGTLYEHLATGSEPSPELALTAHHIQSCASCRDELEALARAQRRSD